MPTYTAPTTRSSGFLVTAAVYNTDLVENIKFFKDAPTFDGAVTASTTLAVGTGLTYTTSLKSTTALATPSALSATQATAFASTVSGAAIMGFGTTNDVSLMNRAGTVVLGIGPNTTTVNMTGLLTASGFGQHTFSAGGNQTNSIRVENTSAGTAAVAAFNARNDSTWNGGFRVLSSTYTTSGPDIAEGANLHWNGSGGLSIAATNASGVIRFYSGGTTERARLHSNGRMTLGTPTVIASASLTIAFPSTNNGMVIENESDGSGCTYAVFTSAQTIGGSIVRVGATAAVAYNTTSDERLKHNLEVATFTDVLRQTVIRDFEWRDSGVTARGVFAQEAYAVAPFAVTVGTDELTATGHLAKPWSVDYSKYVPDLIVGWQQHDATIQSLTARIAALEAGA